MSIMNVKPLIAGLDKGGRNTYPILPKKEIKPPAQKPTKKLIKIPESYEEYLLLSEKDKIQLLKQQK
jgi:hypothetical protein